MKKSGTLLVFAFVLMFAFSLLNAQSRAVHTQPRNEIKSSRHLHNEIAVSVRNVSPDNIFTPEEEFSRWKKLDKIDNHKLHDNRGNLLKYKGYSSNYFRIDKNGRSLWNGKHWQPESFPLKVYVRKSGSRFFKHKFMGYIDYAIKIWEAADNRIKFRYTHSLKDADIIVSFEENLMQKYDENYVGLTDYELTRNNRIIRSTIEIGLLKYSDEVISDGEVKSTIIHEFGHALGLGHSENEIDLMYPYINPRSRSEMDYVELSRGDMEAIKSVIDLGMGRTYSSK